MPKTQNFPLITDHVGHGIGTLLLSNREQNMLYTKLSVEKGRLRYVIFSI